MKSLKFERVLQDLISIKLLSETSPIPSEQVLLMQMSTRNRKVFSFLLSSLLLWMYAPQLCTAKDTISSTETVRDGETLVSEGEVFELGFFSPAANSSKRYVGMWYMKNPDKKVVWVANRENPLLDNSGVLKIGENGNIVILNRTEGVVWSTNVSSVSNSSVARLLDNGNLVLIRSSSDDSNYIWQSYEHPSDTLLQGMKLGVNTGNGAEYFLNSWKAEDDPSPGDFVLGMGRLNLPQLVIWNGSVPYYRSGEWNGSQFLGIPDMTSSYVNGTQLITDGGVYITFTVYQNGNVNIRNLNSSGVFKELIWYAGGTGWQERSNGNYWPPKDQCDIYRTCGPFANCEMDSSPNICRCLQGFEPRFSEEWDRRNWTAGCVRKTQLQCERNSTSTEKGQEDGFVKMVGMKPPDYSNYIYSNEGQCQEDCSKNCSCLAYAYIKGIGCLIWGGTLVDMRNFAVGGQELFIKVPHSELAGKKGLKKYVIALIAVSISITILACIFGTFKMKRKACKKYFVQSGNSNGAADPSRDFSLYGFSEDQETERDKLDLPLYDFETVSVATEYFSDKLGEGGFGPVYKGKLPNGIEIAVKRLSTNSGQGVVEFKNELKLISKLQHRNLVRLLGFCAEREEKMLLYEYMPNGSLDALLFDSTRRVLLDWNTRFNIIDGIARGILYLHRDSRLKVIHRDLKASNILLDEDMNPKISDFGMARIFGGKQTLANTIRVVGTYGYMSPEYAMEGVFSEKSDVFSFGVLVLEIVSSKRNSSFSLFAQSSNLLSYAWRLWNEDKALELMDPTLASSYISQELIRCIHMALLCVQEHAVDRPTMSTIVSMLGSDATLPLPSQPAFTLERKNLQTDYPSSSSDAIPSYVHSNTAVEGR